MYFTKNLIKNFKKAPYQKNTLSRILKSALLRNLKNTLSRILKSALLCLKKIPYQKKNLIKNLKSCLIKEP